MSNPYIVLLNKDSFATNVVSEAQESNLKAIGVEDYKAREIGTILAESFNGETFIAIVHAYTSNAAYNVAVKRLKELYEELEKARHRNVIDFASLVEWVDKKNN